MAKCNGAAAITFSTLLALAHAPLTEAQDKTPPISAATLVQSIKQCVEQKWNESGVARHPMTIRLRLNLDGRLAAPPEIENPETVPRAVSKSAIRAVQACEPFRLPAEYYPFWKDIKLIFHP